MGRRISFPIDVNIGLDWANTVEVSSAKEAQAVAKELRQANSATQA